MDVVHLMQVAVYLAERPVLRPFTFFSKSDIERNLSNARNFGLLDDIPPVTVTTPTPTHMLSTETPHLVMKTVEMTAPQSPQPPVIHSSMPIDQVQPLQSHPVAKTGESTEMQLLRSLVVRSSTATDQPLQP